MTEHNSTQNTGVVSSPIPHTRTISLEKVTQSTFNFIGSLRGLLGLFVVIGLTLISIRFNWELGELLAVDEESRALLPKGYAALDLAGLFLSGYVAIKSKQPILKGLAWIWFVFLLSLSLFAAASYTVSVDARLSQAGNERLLASHHTALADIEQQIATWNTKLADTTRFNRAYQSELNALQAQRDQHLEAMAKLQKDIPPAGLAIFYSLPLPFGLDPLQAASIMRFVWSAAMTITPLLLVLLIASSFQSPMPENTGNKHNRQSNDYKIDKDTVTPQETVAQSGNGGAAIKSNIFSFPTVARQADQTVAQPLLSNRATVSHSSHSSNGKVGNMGNSDPYRKAKKLIIQRSCKPSVRALQKATSLKTKTVGQYLARMAEEGVLCKAGQGYKLVE